jgi:hypothetical protein
VILRSYLSRGSLAVAAAAVLLTGSAGAVLRADAGTPASGSVSDSSRTVTWTAGPFVAPNVTGTAGAVTCAPGLCDDFALHVSTPDTATPTN